MGEYGNEEIQDDNDEIEEEQELDENIGNNQEINIEDFEPINEQDIELEGENFEPSYSIETDIHDYQFEIPNNITFKNTYEEFEPIHDEKNVLACRPPNLNTSWINAIINDPTLTTSEKIEMLEKKKRKLWNNSELSIIERDRISKAIDHAKDKLIGAKGGILDSSISPNRDTAGKHDTSNFKDSQNSIDNKINNQKKFQSEQSEKQDLSGINDKGKELEHKLKEKKEKDNYELPNDLKPENEPEDINDMDKLKVEDEGDVKSTLNINKTEKFYNQNVRETLNNYKIKLDEDFQLDQRYNDDRISKVNPIVLFINKNKRFTMNEINFLQKNNIKIENLKTRYDWVKNENIASKFYREVIYSQFKRIPTTRELHKIGYTGFMAAVKKNLKIGMTELVKKAGFTPSFEFKYEYKDKSLTDLQKFFLNEIYPNFKLKKNLEENQPPTSKEIGLSEYRGLLKALKNKNYSYNEFIRSMGFKPNYEIIYHDKSYSELKDFFTKEIIPDLKEKFELEDYESPSYDEVEKHYRGLLNSLNRFDKTYLDLIKDLNLTPRQISEAELGKTNHEALTFLLSEFMNHERTIPNYYSETKILYPVRNLKIDGLIINNVNYSADVRDRLKNLINIDKKYKNQIKNLMSNIRDKDFLLFDFSNAYFKRNNTKIRTELIARKILKYHELDKSILFLVGTRWPYKQSMRNLPFALGYKNKNISTKDTWLISPFFFSKIIGLNGENLRKFNNIISLNQEGNVKGIKEILEDFNKNNIKILSTSHFKKFLKNSSLNRWI